MAESNIQKYANGEDSGWLSYTNSEKFSGTIWYRKIGNIVQVVCSAMSFVDDIPINTGVEIGTMPSGFRPGNVASSVTVTSRVLDFPFNMTFYTNATRGAIYATANKGTKVPASKEFAFSIMYFTN